MRRALIMIALLAAGLLAPGCGSGDWATGSGTVSVDDQPLKTGIVTFHPVGGGAAAYGQVTEGKFTVHTGQTEGLKTGQYQVTVSSSSIPEPGSKEQARLLTPPRYAVPATSDLKADVKAGENEFKFNLKSTP
jgi:hypothetical protein